MDLYYATGKDKFTDKHWQVCITDCFYLKLKEFNRPYKGELGGQSIEIPCDQFRKEKVNDKRKD